MPRRRIALEPTDDVMQASKRLHRPAPCIDALTEPWPSLEPTDDPVLREQQVRFLTQRAHYLEYLSRQQADLAIIRQYAEAYEARSYRRRRNQAQSAIRRHRAAVLARDGYVCGICGGDIEPADLSIDHITPITHGGSDDPENLQPAHYRCNSRKGNRIGDEASA